MTSTHTLGDLYEKFGAELELKWDGAGDTQLAVEDYEEQEPMHPMVGPFNRIRPNRIQIIAPSEHNHLMSQGEPSYQSCLESLFSSQPAAIIFTDDLSPTPECAELARRTDTAMLQPQNSFKLNQRNRLNGSHSSRTILGVEISQTTLPVAPGRNLAIQVETAVRQHLLRMDNYDAAADFARRQQAYIDLPKD